MQLISLSYSVIVCWKSTFLQFYMSFLTIYLFLSTLPCLMLSLSRLFSLYHSLYFSSKSNTSPNTISETILLPKPSKIPLLSFSNQKKKKKELLAISLPREKVGLSVDVFSCLLRLWFDLLAFGTVVKTFETTIKTVKAVWSKFERWKTEILWGLHVSYDQIFCIRRCLVRRNV